MTAVPDEASPPQYAKGTNMTVIEAAQAVQQEAYQSGRQVIRLDEADQDDSEDTTVVLHRAADSNLYQGTGITFQRCGGGRRIIRKQRGGN